MQQNLGPFATVAGLREWIQRAAAGMPFTNPDDDWVPTAFLVSPRQGITVVGMPALVQAGIAPEQKDAVVGALGDEARRYKATRLGIVVSTWTTNVPRSDFDAGNWVMPSESPAREEQLVVYALSRFDPAQASLAKIIRHPSRPPMLGPWKVMSDFDLVSRFNTLRDYLVK